MSPDCAVHLWAELDSTFQDTDENGRFMNLVCVQCGITKAEDDSE